jgi:hypothetical protein
MLTFIVIGRLNSQPSLLPPRISAQRRLLLSSVATFGLKYALIVISKYASNPIPLPLAVLFSAHASQQPGGCFPARLPESETSVNVTILLVFGLCVCIIFQDATKVPAARALPMQSTIELAVFFTFKLICCSFRKC